MAALPLLEQTRVLCSDIERRRLAVSNVLASSSSSSSNTHQQNSSSSATHPNVNLIKDHFTLRQAQAVREASDSVLDSLDSSEMTNLVQLFVASRMALVNNNNQNQNTSNNAQYNPNIISQRALESFDVAAAHLRDYHRQYPQQPFELPNLERPSEQDIHQVRSKLFTGPERKGKSVDLTKSYKLFTDFQTQSSLAMAQNQNVNNTSGVVTTIVDQEVTYTEFLRDPITSVGKVIGGKRKVEYANLYVPCLQAAAVSLEGYATKTRPLTAAAEIKDTREKVTSLMKTVKQVVLGNNNNTNNNNQQLLSENFSEKVKEAWKRFSLEKHLPQQQQNNNTNTTHKISLLKILQLEEHISLLCTSVVGENLLHSSSEHIARSALRSTEEEAQDDEDDELKFQQDFFFSFYNQPPLSDRVGLTLSENGRELVSKMNHLEKIQEQLLDEDGANFVNNSNDETSGENGLDGEQQNPDDDMTPEERARLANPKNFPLDALGNPIPVWLYKLHQLDKKHFCEICGHAYPGEKIFTQHFSEQVHERGLARIGIIITPMNAAHFKLISTRDGAIATQKRLLQGEENAKRRLRGEDEEEEDAAGNVATRAQLTHSAAQQQQQQLYYQSQHNRMM